MQASVGFPSLRKDNRSRLSPTSYRILVSALVRLGDLLLIAISGLAAAWLRFPLGEVPAILFASLAVGVLVAANVLQVFRVYDVHRLSVLHYQLPRLLPAWLISVGAVLVLLYINGTSQDLSRLWIGYWLLCGWGALIGSRVLLRSALARPGLNMLSHRVAVVGDAELVDACLDRLSTDTAAVRVKLAVRLVGEQPISEEELHALEQRLIAREIDQVVLATSSVQGVVEPVLERLRHEPVEVAWAPQAPGRSMVSLGVSTLGGQPLVRLRERPIDGGRYLLKDALDRGLALMALIFLAPLMLMIAAAIKLTSPGPVLYRQARCGFNREMINIYKFRSMYVHRCDALDGAQVQQAVRGDPRITPLGRLLRRTSLDELPQMLNVLRGEMSLVGPRPHAVAHDTFYCRLIDNYLSRHRVKPGMTGWAQVNGHRGETDTLEKMTARVEHDLHYIENWSLLFDLRILALTIFVGFYHPEAR